MYDDLALSTSPRIMLCVRFDADFEAPIRTGRAVLQDPRASAVRAVATSKRVQVPPHADYTLNDRQRSTGWLLFFSSVFGR